MNESNSFSARAIRGDDRGYTAYHAPRYAYLLQRLATLGLGPDTRILDVGSSRFTQLLHARFGARVDTLGFEPDSETATGHHFHFDLNWAQDRARWRTDLPRYDVVVFAEVIEHLHTAPELVLQFLATLVAPNGRLILQTPNAASLQKRIKLILGRNPYERIRLDPTNPGHFREYTIRELTEMARGAAFTVERVDTGFYFDARFAPYGSVEGPPRPVLGTIKNVGYSILPARLREGVTMILRRDDRPSA